MPPARKALLAQIGGWDVVWLLGRGGLLPAGAWPLILIQAAAAATLAAALRSARWWLPIHLAFTPLALAARALALPPGAWLAAFIALALIYWSSFRTQAPLFLTNRPTASAVAALLPPGPAAALDIGCGIGTLLAALAPRRADLRLTGIETAP
ncbi:MAG: class I SAM-dependent methyltransferase, partial [Azoarcus sp.]|nr:class I SAM-dependent methyltransferase [Azoarcus sp.]